MAFKAILAGGSGLIGNNLLQVLLERPEFSEVMALVRKPLPFHHFKLRQLTVSSLDKLDEFPTEIRGDILYCRLGSTKKKTPNEND
jgi:NAD dependent epimerase/dehydratase family enzyme